MNRVILRLDALKHNYDTIDGWMKQHGASWSVVTKALCGHTETLDALYNFGARTIADSRLDNLAAMRNIHPDVETWYLRLPHPSIIKEVVRLADVSINSELTVIRALGAEAIRQEKTHKVVIMLEMGDLREGILPGNLLHFYETTLEVPGIEIIGLGGQFGCISGSVPSIDQMAQILLYRELLELKFSRKITFVSAGSSILLPLLREGRLQKGVNHFRVGESLFLGTDLVSGAFIDGLSNEVVTLEGEIAEIKEKSLVSQLETGACSPFESTDGDSRETWQPGQRGYRALITLGQVDTEVSQLTPLTPEHQIAGASSDITVINLGDKPPSLKVGDVIKFRLGYGAFVRLMNDSYIRKEALS